MNPRHLIGGVSLVLLLATIAVRTTAPRKPALDGSRAGEMRADNGLSMKLRWCPAGTFKMGWPPPEPYSKYYLGQHPVDVVLTRGFWLGQFEVTQEEWRQVMGTTLAQQRAMAGFSSRDDEGPRRPMCYVSYDEATEFCNRINAWERQAGRLPAGWEYRLPTEAQWEYACRAGTTAESAFGDSLSSNQANFDGRWTFPGAVIGPYLNRISDVGCYEANRWGLCDMHGNVREWCRDLFQSELEGGRDPSGPPVACREDSDRMIRGGGWKDCSRHCLSAYRLWDEPWRQDFNLGFRVAVVCIE